MKKYSLLAIVLFISTAIVRGQDDPPPTPQGSEIELKEILIPPPPDPKSGVAPIHAWYLQKSNTISLSTQSPQGLLVVTVEDGLGNLMLQETVDGDQSAIQIPLPTLQTGYYRITIQSSVSLLVGRFEVF